MGQVASCYVESWPKVIKSHGRLRCDDRPSSSRKTKILRPRSLTTRTPEGRSNQRVWTRTFGDSQGRLWLLNSYGEVWINAKTMTQEMGTFLTISEERVVDRADFEDELAKKQREQFARARRLFVVQVAEAVAPFAAEAWADPDESLEETEERVRGAVNALPDDYLYAAYSTALAAAGVTADDIHAPVLGLGEHVDGAATFQKLVSTGVLSAYDFMPEREADLWYARRNESQLALFENRRRRGSKRRGSKRRGSRR